MLPRLSYYNVLRPTTFLEPEGIVGLPFISFGLPLLSVCFPHPYQWNVCTTANLTIQNMGRQVMVWANGDTSYLSCIFGIAQDMKSHLLVCQTDSYPTRPKANRSLLNQPIIPFILIKYFRNPICPHRSDFGLQRSIIVA